MVAARAVVSVDKAKAHTFHEYLSTGPGKTVLHVPKDAIIFSQGGPADSVFYVQKGRVKISVISPQGKDATLALRSKGDFIGEESLAAASEPLRLATATTIMPCVVLMVDREEMVRALDRDKSLAHIFQSFLLTRCISMQADLIDHLFNSSEKRLARTLLLLSQLESGTESAVQHTTQEALADMIGTTRSRVNFFMNGFRRMGYIQYKSPNDGVKVYRSLFNVLLQD